MIYIATIHWKDDRWITLQHAFLNRSLTEPFRVYAYLTDIAKERYAKFDHVRDTGDPSHAGKLDLLAQDILRESMDDQDILIFLDGDAFPIAPLNGWMHEYLQKYPLIAVQRTENLGDIQPHPCFCVTTTGFWKKIKGSWTEGYQWTLTNGTRQTDVGGNLLKTLEEQNIPWLKLHRTNTVNLDDLLFGVYADIVYHHGAGFRPQKGGRVALDKAGASRLFRRLDVRILEKCIPANRLMQVRYSLLHPYGRLRRKIFKRLNALSEMVYHRIVADHTYPLALIDKSVKAKVQMVQSEKD